MATTPPLTNYNTPIFRIVKYYSEHRGEWYFRAERKTFFGNWKPINARLHHNVKAAEFDLEEYRKGKDKKKYKVIKEYYE